MSMPDYSEAQLDARSAARERFAPGTRVTHAYTGTRAGTVTKLHTGTLKRPRHIGAWHASVTWDGGKPGRHAIDLLRPIDV